MEIGCTCEVPSPNQLYTWMGPKDLKMLPQCLLAGITAGEKSAVILIFICNMSFPLAALRFSLYYWFWAIQLWSTWYCFFMFLRLGLVSLWFTLNLKNIKSFGRFFNHHFFNYFFPVFFLLSPTSPQGTLIACILDPLKADGWLLALSFSLIISF